MKHMLWVLSEEISNEYPQHMLGDEIRKLCQKKVDGNKKKKKWSITNYENKPIHIY